MQREGGPLTPLSISADLADPTRPVLLLGGDLDFQTAGQLWDEVDRLVEVGTEHLVIDAADLRFVDSTGLSVLVRTWRTCQDRGAVLRLREVPRFLANILRITGVAELLARQPSPGGGTDSPERVGTG